MQTKMILKNNSFAKSFADENGFKKYLHLQNHLQTKMILKNSFAKSFENENNVKNGGPSLS